MKRYFSLSMLSLVMAMVMVVMSGTTPTVHANDMAFTYPTIDTTATSEVDVAPDMATIYVSVSVERRDAASAQNDNAKSVEQLIAKLKDLGVATDAIKTMNFNSYSYDKPVDYPQPQPLPMPMPEPAPMPMPMPSSSGTSSSRGVSVGASTGAATAVAVDSQGTNFSTSTSTSIAPAPALPYYNTTKVYTVHSGLKVTVTNLKPMGTILAALAKMENVSVNSVQYGLSNTSAYKKDAIAKAIKQAKETLAMSAEAAGVELDQLQSLTVDANDAQIYPVYALAMEKAVMDTAQPQNPENIKVRASVHMVYRIK